MSDAPPDLVSRGRAIFDRLRGDAPNSSDVPAPPDAPDDVGPPAAPDRPVGDTTAVDHAPETTEGGDIVDPAQRTDDDGDADAASMPSDDLPAGEDAQATAATPDRAAEPDAGPVAALAAPSEVEPEFGAGPGGPAPPELPEPVVETPESVAVPAPATEPEPAGAFVRPLPRVIAVANQKGGVGKTTTAVNLGAGLAEHGYRTLVVDLDPQGNASTGLGINVRDLQLSMYDVILHDTPIEDCVEPTSVRNLFVAPASLDLAGAEIELVPAFSRELRLKRALDAVRDDYDFVLIDCPPSLGLLTVNSMAAASEVLVPIQCEYYALEGLGQLMRNVTLVQKNLNPSLELSIIVLVMYDARTKLADQVVREVREHFGVKVCRTVVPRTVRLSEAPSYGQPILSFDPTSRGAIAYRELAKEVSGGPSQRLG